MNKEGSNRVQVLDRTFSILEEVASYPEGLQLRTVAKNTGINKSTAFRILNGLVSWGYVVQDDEGNYRLTMRLYEVGLKSIGGSDLVGSVHPYLLKAAGSLNECVHFARLDGGDVVYIDKVDPSDNAFRTSTKIGTRRSAFITGLGKAMLAILPDEMICQLWEKASIQQLTDQTITEYERMAEEIKAIRKNGYALDQEENELGLCCIGKAVKDYKGEYLYALSVTVPKYRFTSEFIQVCNALLTDMGERISLILGYNGGVPVGGHCMQ